MARSRIEAWIDETSHAVPLPAPIDSATPFSLPAPLTKASKKRKLPDDTPRMVSPPLSEELPFAADPNLTPRPSSPTKKRRLDTSVPFRQPNFSIDERSERSLGDASSLTGGASSATGSTRTGAAAASKKSSRTRSPVKDMTDLRLAEKPMETIILQSLDQLTQDVLELFHSAKDASELRNIAPQSAREGIMAGRGPLEPRLLEHTFYNMESWVKEHNISPWDALDELRALKRMACRSQEAALLNLTEPAWNGRVHEPLLDIALEPFGGELSHWDVTRASIDKQYLGKHQSGGDLQAKMVDFCITLSDPTLQEHVWSRLARASDNHSINHSSTNPLRPQPIAISIETKVPDGSIEEAKAQLSVWVTSHLKRLRTLSGTSETHMKLNTTLPVVQVNGSIWTLLFLRDGDVVQLIETVTIGDTKHLMGCYQVVAFLRHLGHWALTVFKPWLYKNVLNT